MKKYISLILAAAMALGLFGGCSPEDKALADAIYNTSLAQNAEVNESLSWDVTVEEPYAVKESNPDLSPEAIGVIGGADGPTAIYVTDGYPAEGYNDFLRVMEKLSEDFTITWKSVKQDKNKTYTETKLSLPDLRAKFFTWIETRDDGTAKVVCKIPSYVSPFINKALRGREYIAIDNAKAMDLEAAIVGEDEAAALLVTNGRIDLINLINDISLKMADKFGMPITEKNGNEYTVHIDGEALEAVSEELVSVLTSEDIIKEIESAVIAYVNSVNVTVDEEPMFSPEEINEAYEEIHKTCEEIKNNAGVYVGAIAEELKNSGLLKNGYTAVYTLNNSGLIEKARVEMELDIDVEKLTSALNEIMGIIAGTGADSFDSGIKVKGKFNVKLVNEAEYKYGGAKAEFPDFNESNTLDYYDEYIEYTKYKTALREWRFGGDFDWYDFPDYGELGDLDALKEIKITNEDTGASAVLPCKVMKDDEDYFYRIYVPADQLACVLTDTRAVWNSATMGVEIWEGDEILMYIPNADGAAAIDDIFENSQEIDDGSYSYTGSEAGNEFFEAFLDYYSEDVDIEFNSIFENDVCWVEIDTVFWYIDDYMSKLDEDGGVVIRKYRYDSDFEYDESIKDNFFYIKDNFFYICGY